MKTLILILTILVTLNVNAQGDYKLYSKVWRFEYKSGYTKICPLDDDSFNGEFCDSVDKKLDINKVKSNLLKSFNEFRNDYCVESVVEDVNLSLNCELFSKQLITNFNHDNIKFGMECIETVSIYTFVSIKNSDGDFNKVVADCIFDRFVSSKSHMGLLLSDKYKNFGFGVTLSKDKIYVVVRGY
jgi:hypothetical protein